MTVARMHLASARGHAAHPIAGLRPADVPGGSPMLKRLLLALALVGALGACNTPAGTASPSGAIVTPTDPGLASPDASMEASPSAS